MTEKIHTYCSGPLFCPEEIGGMTAIANIFEKAGYNTFLPHRDGVEPYVLPMVNSPLNINILNIRGLIDRAIFALDVYQLIEVCDFFVFNMNGRVPDEGGVAETAIAYAAGKPIVLYKNDNRTAFNGKDNSMVTGLSYGPIVSDINRLPAEMEKVAKKLQKKGASPYHGDNIPPEMQKTLRFGKRVHDILKRLPNKSEKSSSVLIDEITKICEGDQAE